MTLLLTHSTEIQLPELPLPLQDYAGFALREGDAYLMLRGFSHRYSGPDKFVKNYEFRDMALALNVRDELNFRCRLVRNLLGAGPLSWTLDLGAHQHD